MRTRLTHFVGEDGRVPQAAEAFRREDVEAIGALSAASQADADDLLDNQTPETRTLARLARDCGAFASSGFGAGFGGSVWALAPADEAPAFASRWLDAYRTAIPRDEPRRGLRHAARSGRRRDSDQRMTIEP